MWEDFELTGPVATLATWHLSSNKQAEFMLHLAIVLHQQTARALMKQSNKGKRGTITDRNIMTIQTEQAHMYTHRFLN